MAMSFVSSHRRKVTTYGRASRKPSYDPFAEDASPPKKTFSLARREEDASPVKKSVTVTQRTKESVPLRKTFSVTQRTEVRKQAAPEPSPPRKATGKLVRPSPKKAVDLFDVPSSGDESDPFKFTTTKPSRPLKAASRSAVVKAESTQKPAADSKNISTLLADAARKRKRDCAEKETVDQRQRAKTPRAEVSPPTTRVLKEVAIPSPEKARKQSPRRNVQTLVTRTRHVKTVAKSPPRAIKKGLSAPAALTSMVSGSDYPADTPMTDVLTSDGPLIEDTVVDILPSTPLLAPLRSPGSVSRSGTVTPRQKDLWKKLLDSSDPIDSPGSLPISKLDLSKGSAASRMATLSRSVSDIPRTQRSRLVDTLKRSAPVSEESESDSDEEIMDIDLPSQVVSRSPPKLHRTESGEHGSQDTKTFLKASSKVTYAQARTYLEEQNVDAAFDLIAEEFSQNTGLNASQSQPKSDEELSDEDDSQSKQPRTVHDLRAAGARRRLFEDLEYNIDGTSTQGFNTIAVNRSAIINLTTKLYDKDAVLCILDHGLERKLLEHCNQIDDTVFTVAAAVAFTLIADGGPQLHALRQIYDSQCFKHIMALLENERDISLVVKDRKSNMARQAQLSVVDFKTIVQASDIWSSPPAALSPQLVALKTIETTVRRMREAGCKEVLIDEAAIGTLLSILAKHLPLSLDATEAAATTPGLVLSILESSSLVDPVYRKQIGWSWRHLTTLAELMPALLTQSAPGTEEFQPLALRLCINVTNKSPRACDAFAGPTFVQTVLQSINERFSHLESGVDGEKDRDTLDRLILSHGALLNLAEFSDDARLATIVENDGLLKASVRHFLYGRERAQDADSLQAAQMNIPYGWLAVLLGNLCLAYEVREHIRAEMPNKSLKTLVAAVDEFSKIWARMNLQEFDGEEGQQTVNDFAGRMNAVVKRLRQFDH